MADEFSHYCVRSDVRFQRVGDEGVVVRQSEGEVLVLNSVGMSVLELLRIGATAQDICKRLTEEYAVATDVLEADVAEFLHELTDAGVIECDAGAGSAA